MSASGQNALKTLRFIAGLLAVAGLGMTISALITLSDTSGIFNGGIWTGIISLIICSSILSNKNSVRAFQCLTFSCMVTFIAACVSTAILSSETSLLKNMESCVNKDDCSSGSHSCPASGSATTHDVEYATFCFNNAIETFNCNCFVNAAFRNADDDYALSTNNCDYFDVDNCNVFFTKLPNLIKISYGFSLACLILSFMLMIASCSIVYVPEYRESIILVGTTNTGLQQPIYVVSAGQATYAQQPTPVYVTATTGNPAYYNAYNAQQDGQNIVVVEPYVQSTSSSSQPKTYGV